jgi:excisionase family DNA binding protein
LDKFTQNSGILMPIRRQAMTVAIEPAMTVRDIAVVLNVDEKTIYRLAQKGDLPGFKVSGSWRFQRPDLLAWIEAQKQGVKAVRSSQKGAV